MRPDKIDILFKRFKAHAPNPKTELVSLNDFTMLVAIVLSAQATDKSVNLATEALFKVADTPDKMAELGEAKLKNYIKTIGLYNAKAKNVIALSRMIIDDFAGKIPETREGLQLLPGVGRKTANVWLNNQRGAETIAVDTHVFRVANRLGLCKTTTPDATEECLMQVVPKPYRLHAHHWLILHGRYICVARKPRCYACYQVDLCPYQPKNFDDPKARQS